MSDEAVDAVTVVELAREHFASWARLFDASSCGCHCRFWEFEGDKNAWLARDAADNRAEAERELPRGLVALDARGEVVGWMKLAPRASLPKLVRRRPYAGVELGPDDGVLVVGCFLVHPERRGRDVARRLLEGGVAYARRAGARAIEAYPFAPRDGDGRLHDEQAFLGPASLFASAGFVGAGGEAPYPVVRLALDRPPAAR